MRSWLDTLKPFELVLTMTIVLVILQPPGSWYAKIPLVMAGVAGLALPQLKFRPGYWVLLGVLWMTWTIYNWASADNHKWLTGYWLFALATACSFRDRAWVIVQKNARYLIAFAFLFATVAKVASGGYVNGAFFEYTTLHDVRFRGYSQALGLVTLEQGVSNSKAFKDVTGPLPIAKERELSATERLRASSLFLTWWTVFIEAVIAIVFFLPLARWRDPALLVFLLTTYTVATVTGFGWLLAIMAMALSERRILYLGAMLLITLYEAPVWKLLSAILD